jgi:glycerol-3-phosphate acyltransferase PlsX
MMGSVVAQQAGAPELPRVALLNVGHEETKGHAVVREAHELMRNTRLNYVGFIEGHDLFEGEVDVAVCDGFAGNLILKSSEGLASMLFGEVRNALADNWRSKLGGWLAAPALKAMVERLDPAKHNGAPLLGLNGVVVKSHGRSGRQASMAAILEAGREIDRQVPQRIAAMVSDFDKERIQ